MSKNLKLQIKELERLVGLKEETIKTLQAEIELLKNQQSNTRIFINPQPAYPPTISVPYFHVVRCSDRGEMCVYPFPWHGIIPPSCTKCGAQAAGSTFTVTSTSSHNGDRPVTFDASRGIFKNN